MKVALVWNGDVESDLAYGKIKGEFDVSFLLTFLETDRSNFSFLSAIKCQSEKLGVPFFWAKMRTSNPEEYKETIALLKDDFGIEGIVTSGKQSPVEDACRATEMRVIEA